MTPLYLDAKSIKRGIYLDKERKRVIVKDEMFCPVITIDSQEDLNAVIKYSLVTIEVSKKYSEMEIGEILVINNYDSSKGSSRYNKID